MYRVFVQDVYIFSKSTLQGFVENPVYKGLSVARQNTPKLNCMWDYFLGRVLTGNLVHAFDSWLKV